MLFRSVAIVPTAGHTDGARYFTVEASDLKDTGDKIVREARKTFLPQRQVKQ